MFIDIGNKQIIKYTPRMFGLGKLKVEHTRQVFYYCVKCYAYFEKRCNCRDGKWKVGKHV